MNCQEFEANLEQWEGRGHALAGAAVSHSEMCATCADLKADFEAMLDAVVDMPLVHEPPARMWENIEYTLRTEGVIKPYAVEEAVEPLSGRIFGIPRWAMAATATMVLATGVLVYNEANQPGPEVGSVANLANSKTTDAVGTVDSDEESAFLAEVEQTAPAMKPMYKKNLEKVDKYIADAREAVNADPNDAEALASLRDAQSQRAMLMDVASTQSMR